jgi:hypothetical protein
MRTRRKGAPAIEQESDILAIIPALKRLASGQHRRKVDFGFRIAGMVSFAAPFGLTKLLLAWRGWLAPHRPSPLEFLLACAVVLTLWLSALLLVAGAGLLRPVPRPPRPLYS